MVVGHQNYARERGSRERSHRTRDEHPKMRKLSLVELRVDAVCAGPNPAASEGASTSQRRRVQGWITWSQSDPAAHALVV